MTDTMFVRSSNGAWEPLAKLQSINENRFVDVFGNELSAVFGESSPLIVVSAERDKSADKTVICVNARGDVWVLYADLDGNGSAALPSLLAEGGTLSGMTWSEFVSHCAVPGHRTIAEQLGPYIGTDHAQLTTGIERSLQQGTIRLVAVVQDAAPTLIQAMRFMSASGAQCAIYKARAFSSSDVTALSVTAITFSEANRPEKNRSESIRPETSSPEVSPPRSHPVLAPDEASSGISDSVVIEDSEPIQYSADDSAGVSAEGKVEDSAYGDSGIADKAYVDNDTDETLRGGESATQDSSIFLEHASVKLNARDYRMLERLVETAEELFQRISYLGDGASTSMHTEMRLNGRYHEFLTIKTDGTITISFDDIAQIDTEYDALTAFCIGAERLIATNLGSAKHISQINLSINEHLMDPTLVDALGDLFIELLDALNNQNNALAA